eukprot:5145549-Ditylum_brightwellii.AAC.1
MKVQCNADMFVDNATLLYINSNKFNILAQQLMNPIQHDTEIWGRLLWATGGLVDFLKSTYFLLIWKFAASGKPYIVLKEELPLDKVTVTDANGNITKLTRVTERQGIKMLGVFQAAMLEENDEFNYLMDRTTTYVGTTSACPLQPHEIWLEYTTVYKLCVQYSLSTTCLDPQQIDKLHTASVPCILPCMGYNGSFISAVVFGSKFSDGIGFTHLGATQLGVKICGAVKHARAQTKTGHIFV